MLHKFLHMLLDTPLVAGFGSTTQALKTTTTTQTKTGLFKPTNNWNNSAKNFEKQIVLEVIEKVLFFSIQITYLEC